MGEAAHPWPSVLCHSGDPASSGGARSLNSSVDVVIRKQKHARGVFHLGTLNCSRAPRPTSCVRRTGDGR